MVFDEVGHQRGVLNEVVHLEDDHEVACQSEADHLVAHQDAAFHFVVYQKGAARFAFLCEVDHYLEDYHGDVYQMGDRHELDLQGEGLYQTEVPHSGDLDYGDGLGDVFENEVCHVVDHHFGDDHEEGVHQTEVYRVVGHRFGYDQGEGVYQMEACHFEDVQREGVYRMEACRFVVD